jgi:hypothetical protein
VRELTGRPEFKEEMLKSLQSIEFLVHPVGRAAFDREPARVLLTGDEMEPFLQAFSKLRKAGGEKNSYCIEMLLHLSDGETLHGLFEGAAFIGIEGQHYELRYKTPEYDRMNLAYSELMRLQPRP